LAIQYTKWRLRPGADRARLGDLALDWCRYSRSIGGCRNARYYWADANSVAILQEFDTLAQAFPPPDGPGTKLAFQLSDVADRTVHEIWSDARAGTEAYQRSRA